MLNLESPFNIDEINEILKSFIKDYVFSSSKEDIPDSINNFYGLAVLCQLDLIQKTNLIDVQEINNFIDSELTNSVPEKAQLNMYALLCLKLINQLQKKSIKKNFEIEFLLNFDLLSYEGFKLTIDIYNHLVTLKLLGNDKMINEKKEIFAKRIKKLIAKNGSINNLITESARTLLIFDLLDLKKQEPDLYSNLLNFVLNKTSFFSIESIDEGFNWRSDKLCFKIELEMLYWTLLACSQFAPNEY
jgi:hypothetical protein